MPVLLVAALFVQVHVGVSTTKSDTTKKKDVNVSIQVGGSGGSNRRRRPKRIPVTPEHLRTAFKSELAHTLLERARQARLAQDSALMSYDATANLRISAGMGFSKIGRDRLI